MPFLFWIACLSCVGSSWWALTRIKTVIGIPSLAVLATVAFWYLFAPVYNNYPNPHAQVFSAEVLDSTWLQIALFFVAYPLFCEALYYYSISNKTRGASKLYRIINNRTGLPALDLAIKSMFHIAVLLWLVLVVIGAFRLGDHWLSFFFPYLEYRVDPWSRGRVGSGLDFLLSFAGYLQLLLASIFGVVAALAKDRTTRLLAAILCILSWPYYLFGRTRNTMLAVLLPGFLAWVFLRLRNPPLIKLGILLLGAFLVNGWFKVVISVRADKPVTVAFREMLAGNVDSRIDEVRHEGLNMFEELCWINNFMDRGQLAPVYGSEYLSQALNFVPRSIWKEKPMLNVDYALLRGQGLQTAASNDANAGIGASIAPGLLGQGLINAGRYAGPVVVALLMAAWTIVLARLDLNCDKAGYLIMLLVGLVLTFNLGRGFSLVTLFGFLFGLIILWFIRRQRRRQTPQSPLLRRRRRSTRTGRRISLDRHAP